MSVLLRIAALVGVLSFAAPSAAQTDRTATVDLAFIWDLFTEKVCVPRHLCNDKGFVIEDGAGLVIFRAKVNRPVNDTCSTLGEVVCKTPTEPSMVPISEPTPSMPDDHGPAEVSYKSCGYQKECVPRFLCKDGSILTTGEAIIDIRGGGGDDECNYLDVCCDIPNKSSKPVITPKPPVVNKGCGYRNDQGVGFRITGDKHNEAQFGEFPWMVAVVREEYAPEGPLSMYECGGALIAPNAVITGAYCVHTRTAEQLFVRAGEWDTSSASEVLPHQDAQVEEIIVHEGFNKSALYNDIALLILKDSFHWAENVRPICLPPANTNFDYSRCFATGWGKGKFGQDGNYQEIMKKIDLPVVPHDQCQKDLRHTLLGKYFELHESFMCAGGEKGKDTCQGDGGSPLVCPIESGNNNRFYQAGIVSWGIGCGEENVPGVYANVARLRPWLDQHLSYRNIDNTSYTP